MPDIRLHIPEADYELMKRAAVYQMITVKALILNAAEAQARAVLAERKHIKVVK